MVSLTQSVPDTPPARVGTWITFGCPPSDCAGSTAFFEQEARCRNRPTTRDGHDKVETTVTALYPTLVADREWVLLAYRMPREPSGPRVTVWRKLRRLGALQLVDGLVALPATPTTVEAFEWLAEEIAEADGNVWIWKAEGSSRQDRALRQALRAAVAEEYATLAVEATKASVDPQSRTVQRLRRTLRDIERRDFIGPRERDDARRTIRRLAQSLDAPVERSR